MDPDQQQFLMDNDGGNSGDSNVDFEVMSDEAGENSGGWIQWFCSLEGHEFLVEIDEDFIKDGFNLYGLKKKMTKEKFA
jgi:hypothetical protein